MDKKHIVFGRCPEGVSEEEFNTWYDAHIPEILSIPGFVSAQRYRMDPVVVDEDAPQNFRFLAVYEVEGDFETLLTEMKRANLVTRDSYSTLKDEDVSGPPLPSWWDHVRFLSWNCDPIGDRAEEQ